MKKKTKKIKKARSMWQLLIVVAFIGVILISQMVVITRLFLWNKETAIDWVGYLFLMSIFFIPTLGLTIATILRVKEIQKGEIEKAKKY